jgi:PAS domain S-box-containing protein
MPHTTLTEKYKLFNSCPFMVFIINHEEKIVYENDFCLNFLGNKDSKSSSFLDRLSIFFSPISEEYLKNVKLYLASNIETSEVLKIPLKLKSSNFNKLLIINRVDSEHFACFVKDDLSDILDREFCVDRDIVKNATEAIIAYTLEGKIITWNDSAQKLFDYDKSFVIGKNITDLSFSFPMFETDLELIETLNVLPENNVIYNKKIIINNEVQYFAKSAKLLYDSKNNIYGIAKTFTNITADVIGQELLKKHVENLQSLNSLWENISQNLDILSILQVVTDVTTKFSGAAYGAFFYNSLSADGEAMRLFTLSGAKREDFMKLGMPRNTAIFQKTFNSKEVFILDDVLQSPDFGHNPPHNGLPKGHLAVRSYLSIPVLSITGENLGSLLFGHPEPGKFSLDDIQMMQSVASQAAIAIENSRLLEGIKNLSAKKDVFITMAGHELRTPLTIIKGFIQILKEVNQDLDLDIYIVKVLEQVDRLSILVDDLLDIGQIEVDDISLNKSEFCLTELIKETIESLSFIQNTHKVTFLNQKPIIIHADRRRIQQVIYNLAQNAIKYSPEKDEIIIEAYVDETEAYVKIIDFGLGIAEKHLPNIFDRFYRVPSEKNISGIGIGLYLCNKIIKKHNGSVHVNSVLDQGSEFIFKIPNY